jgi:hypothetical protein
MTKKVEDLLDDLEVRAKEVSLSNDVETLQKEVLKLRKLLETYNIVEEMHITNVEYVCQKGIDNLKHMALTGMLDSDATKALDILHKNLRMARSDFAKKEKPSKKTSEAELLRIVNGTEG